MTANRDPEELAILVHEVRSPVAALAAVAEAIARREQDPHAVRKLVRLALAACRSIVRIVGDAALGSMRLERVDPGRVANEAAAAAALCGARVRVVVAPGTPTVDADPLRLRQALDNLLANAVAHSPPGEEVVVSVHSRNGEVVVSVTDRGAGVPKEDQARIFDAGVRGDVARSGSGLGLAIARAVAEAHGGSLSLDSTPGEGATFMLALPAHG